jgi:hypothetical protein
MSHSDYEDGLKGRSGVFKTGQADRDWEQGRRDAARNQDLIDRNRSASEEGSYDPSQNDSVSTGTSERTPLNYLIAGVLSFLGAIIPGGLFGGILAKLLATSDAYYEFAVPAFFVVWAFFLYHLTLGKTDWNSFRPK